MKLPFNVRFAEAAKFFKRKVPLTRPEFDQLADWAKNRAFTVATVSKARMLQDIQDALAKAIDEGLTLDDFQASLGEIMQARGWAGLRPWHAETVFRTNLQSAYGAGRIAQQRSQKEDFPFLQYHAIDDTRVRATHIALDETVRPIGDPFWRRHYPPWGYNCRCHTESLTSDEAREIGIESVNVIDDGEEGDFTSPGSSDEFHPDLSSLSPELRAQVRKAIADFDPSSVRD